MSYAALDLEGRRARRRAAATATKARRSQPVQHMALCRWCDAVVSYVGKPRVFCGPRCASRYHAWEQRAYRATYYLAYYRECYPARRPGALGWIRGEHRRRLPRVSGIWWNDAPERTQAEVVAVLLAAAARSEGAE